MEEEYGRHHTFQQLVLILLRVIEAGGSRDDALTAAKAVRARMSEEQEGDLEVTTSIGVGEQTGSDLSLDDARPFVTLRCGQAEVQLEPEAACETGMHLIRAAESSMADLLFFTFMVQVVGADMPSAAQGLHRLRTFRAELIARAEGGKPE